MGENPTYDAQKIWSIYIQASLKKPTKTYKWFGLNPDDEKALQNGANDSLASYMPYSKFSPIDCSENYEILTTACPPNIH